jgi:hypothetical protein
LRYRDPKKNPNNKKSKPKEEKKVNDKKTK